MPIIGIPLETLDDHDDNHNMLPICEDIPDDQPYVTLVFDGPLSLNFITNDCDACNTQSKKAHTCDRRRRNPIGSEFLIQKSSRLSPRFSPRRSSRLSSL